MPDLHRLRNLAARALRYELSMYTSLARWVARRPSHGSPGDQPVGYAQGISPGLGLWVFGSAVEVPVAHVLIPWESVRTPVLVLGVWGLLWMLGMLASLRVHPHLVSEEQLRVRYGALTDVRVPWDAVAQVRRDRRDHPGGIRSVFLDDDRLAVAVGAETNVVLTLSRPVEVRTPSTGTVEVREVALLVDDPAAFVTATRARLAARAETAA